MYKLYCRIYQYVFKMVFYLLPWRKPEIIEGVDSVNYLPKLIKDIDIDKVIVITGKIISSIGLMDGVLEGLKNEGVDFVIYNNTSQNPTIDNVEEALEMYKSNNCKGIVAFGGGSPIDCAKAVGARLACPNKSILQMRGDLKVGKEIPPLFAVPTTAGTGSEATIVAVITNSSTHEKLVIGDMVLTPHYAVLDPSLTVGLPPDITAATGMDALTHAIEAYIGRSNTKETSELSRMAVKLIFENIYEVYRNGANVEARGSMLKASNYAGMAFTRAYVGYVHAIAHTLGGFYGTPHGLANAVILPYVLEYYGEEAYKPLAELTDVVLLGNSTDNLEQKSYNFIKAIKKLNKDMNIPDKISGINDSDIPLMVERAYKEANPNYPVPKILSKKDLFSIYEMIKD
ncbi:iron-containing alcohol dehydrogenase [Sedimentibacter saalensis]|uniref:Alcohol dehydrogenase class IV n=1 Tax=Sedimentibacter saalensis TaxID=130788 RepID=A0A562JH98_9FIRM|nr:iron-containing alcohol dehydrogenase [Sedimentibacter saalensis]TWH82550.1 alcohol dehydrogenase class IV [Sedimentibacter saalensis]